MTYTKVTRLGNWGAISYTWNGRPVPTSGVALVRWPDGTTESVELREINHVENVSDHGHSDSVLSRIPTLVVSHFGLELEVNIDAVEIGGFRT